MNETTPHSTKEAINFLLANSDKIDLDALAKDLLVEKFSQVIELMGIDASDLLGKVAKGNPSLFMHYAVRHTKLSTMSQEVISAINSDNIVSAIKLVREYYGLSLRETKDLTDNLRSFMKNNGFAVKTSGTSPYPLKVTETVNAYNQLCEAVLAYKESNLGT